jgi:RNA polymerase sigma factor (sigma-70 family)
MEAETDDPPGIDDVFRVHRDRLVGLARLLTGSRECAEDVVQDTFAAAHARWDTIEDPAGYLTRAVVNRCRDRYRRRLRWQQLPWRRQEVTRLPEIDETWRHLNRLPEPQRQVIVLRYYGDLSFEEIADALERPSSTVRSEHRRALDRLKRYLA